MRKCRDTISLNIQTTPFERVGMYCSYAVLYYIYLYTYGTARCTYDISEDPGVTFWILFGITGLE